MIYLVGIHLVGRSSTVQHHFTNANCVGRRVLFTAAWIECVAPYTTHRGGQNTPIPRVTQVAETWLLGGCYGSSQPRCRLLLSAKVVVIPDKACITGESRGTHGIAMGCRSTPNPSPTPDPDAPLAPGPDTLLLDPGTPLDAGAPPITYNKPRI